MNENLNSNKNIELPKSRNLRNSLNNSEMGNKNGKS
jgi:hypothetical protein